MKKPIQTTIILLTIASNALAQDSLQLSDFSIGVNLSSLVQENSQPALVLKYNFKTNNFVRFQVGFSNSSGNLETDLDAVNSQNNSLAGDTIIKNSPYSNNDLRLRLGYYRTKKIDDRFSFYYGMDFILGREIDFHELNLETKRVFSQQQTQFFVTREKITTTTVGFGVAPMFGLQYNMNRRIQVGYEMHISVISNNFSQDVNRAIIQTSSFDPRIFETTVTGTRNWNEIANTFNPVSGLFVSFRL